MDDGIDVEELYDLRLLTDLALSPDGGRVAFVASESDPDEDASRTGLYVVPADGSRDPHRLTRASAASAPTWGPDGDTLGFLAARDEDLDRTAGRSGDAARSDAENGEDDESGEDGDGDEPDRNGETDGGGSDEPKPQVWTFDLALGGDARQETGFEHGVREFDFAPDGDRLVVSARDPTDEEQSYLDRREEDGPIEVTRLQHKRDGAGWLDDVTTYLFVVDRESGETDRLDDAYGAGSSEPLAGLQPAWGPTDRIAFTRSAARNPDDDGSMDVFTIGPDGSDLRRLTDGSLRCSVPTWSPGGDRLAFAGGNHENWYEPTGVYVAEDEADDGGADARYESLSAGLDRTLARVGTMAWLDGGTVVAPIADEAWTRLAVMPLDGEPRRTYERQGRGRTISAFDHAGDTVALGLTTPDDTPQVFALDAGELRDGETGGPIRRLTSLNAAWVADAPLPDHEVVSFENSDLEEIEAVVYYPSEFDPEADGPAPAIASIHGGPMSYDAPGFRFTTACWTSRGYVVVKPNYRGSTSYGRAFSESLKGSRGDLESDDVISAMDHLVAEGVADPDRLFCTGFSYGGITTAHVVTRTDEFAAAAPEHGVYDFYSNFGTDDNHNWHEWEFGMPWENEETYRDISSISRVDRIDTPLLITAGEEDWRCPPTQAEQLYVSVRKRGVDAKLVIYPDEHHNIGDPKRATHRIEELTEWFEAHDPALSGDDEEQNED
ncbi:S9 family peptidase [Halorarum halobium]|uniref:S9 family peptidase n=1 Tax=Halorarum halobium TaxID=3075121 RepID=UPI0028AF2CB3|nr:S9 family peptidase [Halobaculum sp. XH14]